MYVILQGGKEVGLNNGKHSDRPSDAQLIMTIPSYDISAIRKTQSVAVAKLLNSTEETWGRKSSFHWTDENPAEVTSDIDADSKVELLDFAVDASAWQSMAGDWAPGDLFDVRLWQVSTLKMWRAVVSVWDGRKALTPLDDMVVGRLIAKPTLQRARTEGADHQFDPDSPFKWSTDIEIMLAKPTHTAAVPIAVAISPDDGITWKISLQAFKCSTVSHAHASSLAASRLLSVESDGPVTCIWGSALGLDGDIEWRPRNAQAEGLLHLRLQQQKKQRIKKNKYRPEPGELVWFLTPETMAVEAITARTEPISLPHTTIDGVEPPDDPEHSNMELQEPQTENRDALRRVWVMGTVLDAPSKYMRTVRLLMHWNNAAAPLPLSLSPDSAEADFVVHIKELHPVPADPFSPQPSEPTRCHGLALWRAFLSRSSLTGREAFELADFLQLIREECERQHAQRHICHHVVDNESRLIIHTRGNQLYEAPRSHSGRFCPVGIPNTSGDAPRDAVWPIGKLLQRASLAPRLHVGAMVWIKHSEPYGRIVRVSFDRGLPFYIVRPFKMSDAKVLNGLAKKVPKDYNLAQPERIHDDGAPRSLHLLEEHTLPSGECVVATKFKASGPSPGALKHTAAADSPVGTEVMREYKRVLPDVLQVTAGRKHFAALVSEPLNAHCSCRGRRPAVYIQLTPNKGEPKHNKWCQHHFRQCFYADVDLNKPEEYEERLLEQFKERQIYQISNGNTLRSLFDWCTMCPPRPTKNTHECLQCGVSLCKRCFLRHKADGHQQVRRKAGVLSRIKSVRIWGNAKFLRSGHSSYSPCTLPWLSGNHDKTSGKTRWPFDTGYGVDFASHHSSLTPIALPTFTQPHASVALDLRESLNGTPFLVGCGDDYSVIASIKDYRREPTVHGERDVDPIVSVNFVDQHHVDGSKTALMIMPNRHIPLTLDVEPAEDTPEVLRSLEVELWVWRQAERFHLLRSGLGERASFKMTELFDTMPATDAVEDLVFRERDKLYGARYCDETELREHMNTFLFQWEQSANDRLNAMKQRLLREEQRAFGHGGAAGEEAAVATAPFQEIQKQREMLRDKLRAVQTELRNSFATDTSLTAVERAEFSRKIKPLRQKLHRWVE